MARARSCVARTHSRLWNQHVQCGVRKCGRMLDATQPKTIVTIEIDQWRVKQVGVRACVRVVLLRVIVGACALVQDPISKCYVHRDANAVVNFARIVLELLKTGLVRARVRAMCVLLSCVCACACVCSRCPRCPHSGRIRCITCRPPLAPATRAHRARRRRTPRRRNQSPYKGEASSANCEGARVVRACRV